MLIVALPIFISLWSCQPDDRNYEAEIISIHFMHQVGRDTMLLVSDTIIPTSTSVNLPVDYRATLQRLVPIVTLSRGATANIVSGRPYDFSKPFTIAVTSENERHTRYYIFGVMQLPPPPVIGEGEPELNSEAQLMEFMLEGVQGEMTVRGPRITIVVPEETDLTNLTPSFTLSDNATCDYELGTPYDFTDPLYIRVVSQDQSCATVYRIIVRHPEVVLSPDAQILSFRFAETKRPVYIEGSRIYAELEKGVDIKELTPIYKLSAGAKCNLELGEIADFSQPVRIEVTSEDKNAKSVYTVYTSLFKSREIAIDAVQIESLGEYSFKEGNRYTWIVESNVDITKLTPEVIVSKGCTTDLNPSTTYDLTDPLAVAVTSEDGSCSQIVTLQVKKAEGKEQDEKGRLQTFEFANSTSTTIIRGNEVHVRVPEGTDLTKLIPKFQIFENVAWLKLGHSIGSLWTPKPNEIEILSEETELDFSSPLKLIVWRKLLGVWGERGAYTFYVTHETKVVGEANIREFKFTGTDISLSLRGNLITGVASMHTDITALIPSIRLSEGATCSMESGKAYDFSTEQKITVTSKDGAKVQYYTVKIEKRLNDQAQLTEFRLKELPNAPTVNGSTITFFAGGEIDVTKLTPTFTLSRGATANIVQNESADFSRPVRVVVTSEDGNISRSYTVVVDQRLNYEADIQSFRFLEIETPCKISGTRITFVPGGKNPASLTPEFTLSPGATCDLISGSTGDFSKPVRIVVTSEDKSNSKSYTVRQEQTGITFDFERWQSFESKENLYEHPVGAWSSGNVGMLVSRKFTGKPDRYPVRKSSEAHGGSFAAEITTEALGVQGKSIAAGALFLGSFNGAVVMNDHLSAPQFGTAWPGGKPDKFSGWYKYTPGSQMVNQAGNAISGTDEMAIYAILYYGNTLTAKDVQTSDRIIAIARIPDGTAKSEWTRFEIPFEYKMNVPDGEQLKYSIVMSSSRDGDNFNGAVGSRLLVDDLEISLQ